MAMTRKQRLGYPDFIAKTRERHRSIVASRRATECIAQALEPLPSAL